VKVIVNPFSTWRNVFKINGIVKLELNELVKRWSYECKLLVRNEANVSFDFSPSEIALPS